MRKPRRFKHQAGRHALVDGIPFRMPINTRDSPALVSAFIINADKAKDMLPGNELHPLRLWGNRGLLFIAVANYEDTDIGKYIEFSVAIGCTRGPRPAPWLLPAMWPGPFGAGQYIYDLPVSTEVSFKGGRGIWGMPKRQASLDFVVGEETVSSQYDLDGQLVMKIEIERPRKAWLPLRLNSVGYSDFRGMLWKSRLYLQGKVRYSLFNTGASRLVLGTHPRAQPLKELEISESPLFVGFSPSGGGALDDHIESWYLTYDEPPKEAPEGMETVVDLGLSQEWLPPPTAPVPGDDEG